jgi:hypothetical protein
MVVAARLVQAGSTCQAGDAVETEGKTASEAFNSIQGRQVGSSRAKEIQDEVLAVSVA